MKKSSTTSMNLDIKTKEVLSAISEDEIHSELQYTKLMDALMKETTIK